MLSGSATNCQIVISTSNVRELQGAVLTRAPTMSTPGDLRVESMLTVWPPDTRRYVHAPRPIQATHLCPVDPSHSLTYAIQIRVDPMPFVNPEKIKGPERTDQCAFVMKAIEATGLQDAFPEIVFL